HRCHDVRYLHAAQQGPLLPPSRRHPHKALGRWRHRKMAALERQFRRLQREDWLRLERRRAELDAQPIRTKLHEHEKSEALVVWRYMMSIRRGLHWVLTLVFVHLFTCMIPFNPAGAAETSVESGVNRQGGDYKDFALEPSVAGFGPCK